MASEISNVSAVRVSDYQNVVYWNQGVPSDDIPSVVGYVVERSTDGGPWSSVLGGSMNVMLSPAARHYYDTTTAPDHWYRYRVGAVLKSGGTKYAETTQTLYNTPAAPKEVVARRVSSTNVFLSITNGSVTSSYVEIQRAVLADSPEWEHVAIADSAVVGHLDVPGESDEYLIYRVRNIRPGFESEWTESNPVVTLREPADPTLTAPASGVTVPKSQESVVFSWVHNSADGSEQTEARLEYSTDGGVEWTTVYVSGSASSVEIPNDFPNNSTVTWRVATKGEYRYYGPNSADRVFYVRQVPSVSFASPANGSVITGTPVRVELQYSDPSGQLANAALTIREGGRTVYGRDLGIETSCEIAASEWLPESGKAYELTAAVRSTSTLTATAASSVSVEFVPPQAASVSVRHDAETSYACLTVSLERAEGREEAESVAVWRESQDGTVLLSEGLQDGSALVDRYAPANVDYRYKVVSFANSGAASVAYVDARFDTQWFYFIWEGGIARGRINPEGSRKLTRPNRRRRHFAGRQAPVSFDDGSVEDKRSVSLLLRSKDEADKFEDLMWDGGRCVYKSGDGDVMHADVEMSDKQAWMQPTYHGAVTLTVTRIDGKEL